MSFGIFIFFCFFFFFCCFALKVSFSISVCRPPVWPFPSSLFPLPSFLVAPGDDDAIEAAQVQSVSLSVSLWVSVVRWKTRVSWCHINLAIKKFNWILARGLCISTFMMHCAAAKLVKNKESKSSFG